jgi:Bacterial archaeo-eukaryotic release factor family 7
MGAIRGPRELLPRQKTFLSGHKFMHTLNRDQLRFLSQTRGPFCVSIFLPTHRAGQEIRQDPIRLKNLAKQAETKLISGGLRAVKAREILAPARNLTRRAGFWRTQEDGLAVFLSQGFFQYFRVPLALEEIVFVGQHFDVGPLLPWFTAGGTFYLLAFSRNHVRLFRGTPEAVTEVPLAGAPRSLDEALKYDVRESQQQVHTGAHGSAVGKEAAVFTAQGIGVDDEEARTREFLLQVEKGVHHALRDQHAPLVLAAVTELVSEYRAINKYEHLFGDAVIGNPDLLNGKQLHEAAWPVVRPYFDSERKKALSTYQELANSGKRSNNLREILPSAFQGRVDSVFVASGHAQMGPV